MVHHNPHIYLGSIIPHKTKQPKGPSNAHGSAMMPGKKWNADLAQKILGCAPLHPSKQLKHVDECPTRKEIEPVKCPGHQITCAPKRRGTETGVLASELMK